MKKHTRIYFDAFGYDKTDFVPCEISGARAVDIHHIESRGMGGDPLGEKDRIENLMAVTRDNHNEYGDKPIEMVFLFETHRNFMIDNGVKFDNEYIEDKIKYYSNTPTKNINKGFKILHKDPLIMIEEHLK